MAHNGSRAASPTGDHPWRRLPPPILPNIILRCPLVDPFCTHLRDRVRIQKSICWLEMSQISRLGRFSHILCDLSLFQACSIIVASDPVNQLKMFGQCCATEDELATENQKELVLHAWSCSFSCRG